MRVRIPSGITGLDSLIGGGVVPYSTTLITGRTGTGKTIASTQFLYYGATKFGENGVYVTIEETADELRDDMAESFGWDLRALESQKKLSIVEVGPEEQEIIDIKHSLYKEIKRINARRVVLDSVSVFEIFGKDIYQVRHDLLELIRLLKAETITALLTAQIPETNPLALSTAEMIEFIVDNIIKLDNFPPTKGQTRSLTVRKMRRTNHSTEPHPFKITKNGITIKNQPIKSTPTGRQ